MSGSGTRDDPWRLKTPPGQSDFEAWRDEEANPPALVVQVGKTECATTCARSTTCTRC
jgi:hypothetical protein